MNNSEKKDKLVGLILGAAILSAALTNADLCDAEPDESTEKRAENAHGCNRNCETKCKSCGEKNSKPVDREIMSAYCFAKSCLHNGCYCSNQRKKQDYWYEKGIKHINTLGKALGIEIGD